MKTYGGRCAKRWPSVGSTGRRGRWRRRRPSGTSLYPSSSSSSSSRFFFFFFFFSARFRKKRWPSLKVHDLFFRLASSSGCASSGRAAAAVENRSTIRSRHRVVMPMETCRVKLLEIFFFSFWFFRTRTDKWKPHDGDGHTKHEKMGAVSTGGRGQSKFAMHRLT